MSATLAADSRLEDLGYQPSLNRQLSFGSLLVYGLLFFVPMAPVAVFGPVVNRSGGVPVLVYLVAAAVMGLSAISYREIALRFPVAGSVYGYTRFSLGRTPGFIAGWLILLDYILMPALLTVLSTVALAHIWPSVPMGIFALVLCSPLWHSTCRVWLLRRGWASCCWPSSSPRSRSFWCASDEGWSAETLSGVGTHCGGQERRGPR